MATTISGAYPTGFALTSPSQNPLTITSSGSVRPAAGGAIYGNSSQAWTIGNYGTVASSDSVGIDLVGIATVTNFAGGSIHGAGDGIEILGQGAVYNAGSIAGASAVFLRSGGAVGNPGHISGA